MKVKCNVELKGPFIKASFQTEVRVKRHNLRDITQKVEDEVFENFDKAALQKASIKFSVVGVGGH